MACGDLSGYDADASYPLDLPGSGGGGGADQAGAVSGSSSSGAAAPESGSDGVRGSGTSGYVYRAPTQPPIRPQYFTYLQQKKAAAEDEARGAKNGSGENSGTSDK